MSRGRFGGGRFGGGGFKPGPQVPFELFPEIGTLSKPDYSTDKIQLIRWSWNLQKYWRSSPYYYEDKKDRFDNVQKPDIERYSDRNSEAANARPPLSDFIKLDTDHFPAELARGGKRHVAKKVRWNPRSDMHKLDLFEKLEQKAQGQGETEDKENEGEDEEEDGIEDDGEYSDEGDYEQNEYFDDDEDDFNMADDNNDEPYF